MERIDLELGMLAIMYIDQKLENVKLHKLDRELFEFDSNKAIFDKMLKIRQENSPCDMLMLYQGYGFTQREAEQIRLYIDISPGAHMFDLYYNTLLKLHYKRKAEELAAGTIDFEEYNESINKYHKINRDLKVFNTKTDMNQFLEELDKYIKGDFAIYKFGIPELDKKLGDVVDGTMIVVAGKTSTGKTWMMLQAGWNIAETMKVPVLYLTCEMGKFKLVKRLIQGLTGINIVAGSKDVLEVNKDYKRVIDTCVKIGESDFTIAETSAFDEKTINDLIKSTGAKVVLLDFIQQFNLNNSQESRAATLSDIATGIKRMATKHEILMIVGSQLNRTGGAGQLEAIKESSGISENSDIVIMLERLDDTYVEITRKVGYKVHVSKNRDGETGVVDLSFSYFVCKFIPKDTIII